MKTADRFVSLKTSAPIVAAAVTGGTVDQCSDVGSVGGDTITCDVTITNDFTYNPATPNNPTGQATIVTTISCTGSAAGACGTAGTTFSTVPITTVTQCNDAAKGGASTLTCTVTITNNLDGYPTGSAIDSTVRQCQSPGDVNTLTCTATPPGNDRLGDGGPGGQEVIQCNRSGGAGGTMTCTATAPVSQSTGLPTEIRQCQGSGNVGASTVTCTATITNNFTNSTAPLPGGGGPGGGGPGGGGPGGGGPGGGGPGGGDNDDDGDGSSDGDDGDGSSDGDDGTTGPDISGPGAGGGTQGPRIAGSEDLRLFSPVLGGAVNRADAADRGELPATGVDLRAMLVGGSGLLLLGGAMMGLPLRPRRLSRRS